MNSVKNPLVTIIIPIFNVEVYLNRCIDSVLQQTYQNIECLLIDDGSTDNSSEICDEYAKKDSRIKVIHKNNEGVSIARNIGLDKAQGQYICFLDGDDWYQDNLIETAVAEMSDSDVPLLMWGINYYDGNSVYKQIENEKDFVVIEQLSVFPEWYNSPWTKFIKKSFLDEYNIRFPEHISMAEDMYFSYLCLSHLPKIRFISNSFYNYFYCRKDSACNKIDYKKILDEINSINLLQARLDKDLPIVFYNSLYERKINAKKKLFYQIKTIGNVNYFRNLYPEIKLKLDTVTGRVLYFLIQNKLDFFVTVILEIKKCIKKQS